MKYILTLLTIFILYSCTSQSSRIPGTQLKEKVFELSVIEKDTPSMSFQSINSEVDTLNKYIGSYPPHFKNENEREMIYQKWLTLVSDAEAYNKVNPQSEKALYLLSELYRQGHNMDVKGSAEKALSNLDACLQSYEYSVPCNFSASYFYLSIGPKYLDKAEKSLSILAQHFGPALNDEVEAGYVFLYLYRQNVPMAKNQIDLFIKKFPNSSRVKTFQNIKANLGESIEWKNN